MAKRHRWGEKLHVTPFKSEQQCLDCGVVKVYRAEREGNMPIYWNEFWRGLDRIEGSGTPACEPVAVTAPS